MMTMEFFLLTIFTCLSLALVASHAALSPEAYWQSALQNTPMPKAVSGLLPQEGKKYKYGASSINQDLDYAFFVIYAKGVHMKKSSATIFFLENDVKRGKNMTLHFPSTINSVPFLPREDAEKIPFTSAKFPEILKHFAVGSNSLEAETMKKTIKACEDPGVVGEVKHCATSLESMVDFAISKLGENIDALSTEAEKETGLQWYTIVDAKNVSNSTLVVCHNMNYVYPVFYCHKIPTHASEVTMVGADGTKVKAVAVCHADTSTWSPKHPVFQLLKVKPGSVAICHFLPDNCVIWVAK